MTEVILIRHGVTAWNRQRRFQGSIDIPLEPEGHAEAEQAAGREEPGNDYHEPYEGIDGDVSSLHAGTHARLADRFGVHPRTAAGVIGCEAAVWAPHASAVAGGSKARRA